MFFILLPFQGECFVLLIMCPRRCRWVMYYWAFSLYGLFGVDYFPKVFRWVMNYWAFSPCGLFGVDYFTKVLSFGYGLLGF